MCVCVCVCVRERERERWSLCLCTDLFKVRGPFAEVDDIESGKEARAMNDNIINK